MAAAALPPSSPHLVFPPPPSPSPSPSSFSALGGSHESFASLNLTTRPWNKLSRKRRVGTVFAASVLLLRVKIYVCAGSGAKVGSKRRICSTCGGRGQVMRTEQTPIGLFSQVSACLDCGGDGEVSSEYCRKCSGEGRVRVKKSIKVKVPPRVSRGSILRVAGEGGAGPRGGPPGDLYVYLDVEEVEGI